MQLLFGYRKQKQVLQRVPNDDWVKGFGSAMLEIALIEDCHGWSFDVAELENGLQSCVAAWKMLRNDGKWWNKPTKLVFFEYFPEKLQKWRNENLRAREFFCFGKSG